MTYQPIARQLIEVSLITDQAEILAPIAKIAANHDYLNLNRKLIAEVIVIGKYQNLIEFANKLLVHKS